MNFNKLAGPSTLKKVAPAEDDPLAKAIDRITSNLSEMVKPSRLEKGAMVERIRALGDKIREDIDGIKQTVELQLRDLAKRKEEYGRQMFKARSFALDANDPRAEGIIANALRRDPSLLDKISKPQ